LVILRFEKNRYLRTIKDMKIGNIKILKIGDRRIDLELLKIREIQENKRHEGL
jgi:hypothetical protein